MYRDPFGLCKDEGPGAGRTAATIGVGFVPVVGSLQSIVELFTGYDYIAGEKTSRGWAAVGIVAGLVPGGKGAVKGGVKLLGHADDATRVLRHSDDAAALIDLAKQAKRTGVSPTDAKTLLNWADEYKVKPAHGPEIHPNRNVDFEHIHVGPVDHIPVNP